MKYKKLVSALLCLHAWTPLMADNAKETATNTQPTTVYTNVNLIDGVSDSLQSNMAIVVKGEKIQAVVAMDKLGALQLKQAEHIDTNGWYATPGLIESHTHLATEPNRQYAEFILNRQLYSGITTARDLAGDARALADLSRAALINEIPAPDLKYVALMAGPSFFSDPRTHFSALGETPGTVPWMQGIDNDSDVKSAVTTARGTWATAIKTYAKLDGANMKRIGFEARRQGIPVWSHAYVGPARPLEVAQARVHSMSHACDFAAAVITDEQQASANAGSLNGYVDVDISSPKIDAVFEEMVKHETVLDPTLRLFEMINKDADLIKVEREKMLEELKQKNPNATTEANNKRSGIRPKCNYDDAINIVQRAHKAGVRISTGTDGWTGNKDPYPAILDEIRILNENVGLPMMEVIKAATINGAYSIGQENLYGSIEVGKLANIGFYTDNPLASHNNFRSITLTVKRGQPYYRKDFVLGHSGVDDDRT